MNKFQELAAALRGEFLDMARERTASMRRQVERIEAEPGDAEALAGLQLSFHNFAGSGSTYGFPGLSALGLEGERWCAEHRGRALDGGARAALRALFARVEDSLRAAEEPPAP